MRSPSRVMRVFEEATMFEGQEIKEGTPSRRDFLLGIVVTSAVALPMFSPPARAAVSMLHTGLDPNLVESPSLLISGWRVEESIS